MNRVSSKQNQKEMAADHIIMKSKPFGPYDLECKELIT